MKAICDLIPNTVLVLGPSGSGKDVQIDTIVRTCGFVKIGTGDMFREEYEKKTDAGIKAFSYWGEGKWVPNDLVYRVFSSWITRFDNKKPWIFSQVVRDPGQVPLFDELLCQYGRTVEMVIHFTLSEEAATERMSLRRHCQVCGKEYHLKFVPPKDGKTCDVDGEVLVRRDDDHPEAIRMRLVEYTNKVLPVTDEYKKRGILITVDASPPIEQVWENLCNAIRGARYYV